MRSEEMGRGVRRVRAACDGYCGHCRLCEAAAGDIDRGRDAAGVFCWRVRCTGEGKASVSHARRGAG